MRLPNCSATYKYKTTTDGVDFITHEHRKGHENVKTKNRKNFDPKMYSHKFKHSGWRYEVCVSIYNDAIVWINGPFKAGENNDLGIFIKPGGLRDALRAHSEVTIADNLYKGHKEASYRSKGNKKWKKQKARVLARHESVNSRLKAFGRLDSSFYCKKNEHRTIFIASAVFVQADMQFKPLMDSFE